MITAPIACDALTGWRELLNAAIGAFVRQLHRGNNAKKIDR